MVTVEDIWPAWHAEERLGSGAFGTVWRASASTSCAVKIIQIAHEEGELESLRALGVDATGADALLERRAGEVLAEVEALDALRGEPNVVQIED